MGVPIDFLADLGNVLKKHGVKNIRNDDLNALIKLCTPMFEPDYPAPKREYEVPGRG